MGQETGGRRRARVRVQSERLTESVSLNDLAVAFHAVLSSWPVSVVGMINLVLASKTNCFFNERLFHLVRQLPPLLAQDFADFCVAHFWVVSVHFPSSPFGPHHERIERPLDVAIVVHCQMEVHVDFPGTLYCTLNLVANGAFDKHISPFIGGQLIVF